MYVWEKVSFWQSLRWCEDSLPWHMCSLHCLLVNLSPFLCREISIGGRKSRTETSKCSDASQRRRGQPVAQGAGGMCHLERTHTQILHLPRDLILRTAKEKTEEYSTKWDIWIYVSKQRLLLSSRLQCGRGFGKNKWNSGWILDRPDKKGRFNHQCEVFMLKMISLLRFLPFVYL